MEACGLATTLVAAQRATLRLLVLYTHVPALARSPSCTAVSQPSWPQLTRPIDHDCSVTYNNNVVYWHKYQYSNSNGTVPTACCAVCATTRPSGAPLLNLSIAVLTLHSTRVVCPAAVYYRDKNSKSASCGAGESPPDCSKCPVGKVGLLWHCPLLCVCHPL